MRATVVRNQADRGERSLRRAVGSRREGTRFRPGEAQRERRSDCAWAPDWGERHTHPGHPALRNAAKAVSLRPGYPLHWWRPGRGYDRGTLVIREQIQFGWGVDRLAQSAPPLLEGLITSQDIDLAVAGEPNNASDGSQQTAR